MENLNADIITKEIIISIIIVAVAVAKHLELQGACTGCLCANVSSGGIACVNCAAACAGSFCLVKHGCAYVGDVVAAVFSRDRCFRVAARAQASGKKQQGESQCCNVTKAVQELPFCWFSAGVSGASAVSLVWRVRWWSHLPLRVHIGRFKLASATMDCVYSCVRTQSTFYRIPWWTVQ